MDTQKYICLLVLWCKQVESNFCFTKSMYILASRWAKPHAYKMAKMILWFQEYQEGGVIELGYRALVFQILVSWPWVKSSNLLAFPVKGNANIHLTHRDFMKRIMATKTLTVVLDISDCIRSSRESCYRCLERCVLYPSFYLNHTNTPWGSYCCPSAVCVCIYTDTHTYIKWSKEDLPCPKRHVSERTEC